MCFLAASSLYLRVICNFEIFRVLLRILTDPAFVSRQYNACSEWKKDVRFLSFAHTCKRYDTSRSLEERKSNPELLDYAWVEADPFTLAPKLDTAVHNRLAENIYLGQVAVRTSFPFFPAAL